MTRPQHVAVIGAGVVGSSVAAALEASGVEVTVIASDATGTGPVSRASLAWVNARAKAPEYYRLFNADARARWIELAPSWFHATGARADGEDHAADGWVDTAAAISANLASVSHLRVETVADPAALREDFDAVVVAAGSGTATLAPGSPRLSTTTGAEGYLVRFAASDAPFDRIVSIRGLQLRPDGDGRVAAQSLTIENRLREDGVPASAETVWPALRAEILAATGWAPSADTAVTIDRAHRTHPVDGLPVIGWVGGVYAVVAHSGVTLAPLLAELAARDLLGDEDPRLAPFRP